MHSFAPIIAAVTFAALALAAPSQASAQASPASQPAPAASSPAVPQAGVQSPTPALPALRGVPAAVPAAPSAPSDSTAPAAQASPPAVTKNQVTLVASFGDTGAAIGSGLDWRIFSARANASGAYDLVAESKDAAPNFALADGNYIAHAAYGLAGAVQRFAVAGAPVTLRVPVNAGGLRVVGMLGDTPIPPNRIALSFYVPEPGNNEAKLILTTAKVGDIIVALPDGTYHVVSTYLDLSTAGTQAQPGIPSNATNSVVEADFLVQTGKLTDVTLRHHAATMTLKLVNQAGGEALANTSFSVLTTGGDIIREMIGAFPSITLAEGEYVVIARHDGNTYQSSFTVDSGSDKDVEVLAK